MIRIALIGSTFTLAACTAQAEPAPGTFLPATLVPEAGAVRIVELPKTLPLPGQLLPRPSSSAAVKGAPPLRQIEAANRAALLEPGSGAYVNAVQVYPWSEGALYRLYAAPEQLSDIALQSGEKLVAVAAGDTVRWVIGDTTSGSGASKRTHVLVKPIAPGLKTNMVITTDRRSYHLALESTTRTAMAALSWTYPADALLALRREAAEAQSSAPVASGIRIEDLRFGYRISGHNPSWRPLRAFDDGRQVFIEMPGTIAQGEAPPLFVLGPKGEAELVNYRLRGHYYIVDRLFEAAELRLGAKPQQVVRIARDDDARSRHGKGRGR